MCPAGLIRNSEIYTTSAKSILNNVRLRKASGIAYCESWSASGPASAVAVHVAEATDVHENVEAELMPGAEGPKHFIVLAAMAEAEIYDLAADNFACGRNGLANLAIRIMTVFVDESRCQLEFQRLSIE